MFRVEKTMLSFKTSVSVLFAFSSGWSGFAPDSRTAFLLGIDEKIGT